MVRKLTSEQIWISFNSYTYHFKYCTLGMKMTRSFWYGLSSTFAIWIIPANNHRKAYKPPIKGAYHMIRNNGACFQRIWQTSLFISSVIRKASRHRTACYVHHSHWVFLSSLRRSSKHALLGCVLGEAVYLTDISTWWGS